MGQLFDPKPLNPGAVAADILTGCHAWEWRKFCKGGLLGKGSLPEDIPANPNQTYKKQGWMGMGDWLGTGTIAPRLREFRSFYKAREFTRGLDLNSQSEWRKFCKGELLEKGVLIRTCEDFQGLDETYFRVAVKKRNENKKLISELKKILS